MTYATEPRRLARRYVQRFRYSLAPLNSLALARRLERRIPPSERGPAARAMLQQTAIEAAGRQHVDVRW